MGFNKKPRLPKYDTGGYYNDRRANQYAGMSSSVEKGFNQMANNSSLDEEEKTYANNQIMQNTADNAIQQTPGFGQYYGAMKGASDFGKSLLAKDQYGNYKTGVDKAGNEIMTADHSSMLNDISNKNYVALGLDSMGLGKFGRMFSDITGNSQKTTGGWGKFNKTLGITPDKQFKMGGKMCYPNGGMANAEVEKQENTVAPDGEFTQYNGPSHEAGGIPTNLDSGEMIFSDKLKLGKKTFAQLNKVNNTNKEDKLLESTKTSSLTKRTAELLKMAKLKNSTELFEHQEALKQDKVNKYAQKLGVNITGNQPVMRNGGMYKFPFGGKKNNDNIDDLTPREQQEYQKWFNDGSKYAVDNGEEFNADDYSLGNYRKTFNPISSDKGISPSIQNPVTRSQGSQGNTNWAGIGSNLAMGLANNAGNIYNLSRYNKPEVESYQRATPSFLNSKEAMSNADLETRRAEQGIRNASGGNAAGYLANRQALNTRNTLNKAAITERFQNANAGIANQFNMYNTGLSQQETIANAQNRARTRSGKGEAIGSMGYNIANQMRDNKLADMDQKTLELMMKYYDTPEFKNMMKNNKFQRKTGK